MLASYSRLNAALKNDAGKVSRDNKHDRRHTRRCGWFTKKKCELLGSHIRVKRKSRRNPLDHTTVPSLEQKSLQYNLEVLATMHFTLHTELLIKCVSTHFPCQLRELLGICTKIGLWRAGVQLFKEYSSKVQHVHHKHYA